MLLSTLLLAFPAASEPIERCAEPPRNACLAAVVSENRVALEAATTQCATQECYNDALKPALAKLGVRRPAQQRMAMASFMSLPRFHDETGAPLNEAAARLVQGKLEDGWLVWSSR